MHVKLQNPHFLSLVSAEFIAFGGQLACDTTQTPFMSELSTVPYDLDTDCGHPDSRCNSWGVAYCHATLHKAKLGILRLYRNWIVSLRDSNGN